MSWVKSAAKIVPALVKLGVTLLRLGGGSPKKTVPPVPKVVRIRDVKRADDDQEN